MIDTRNIDSIFLLWKEYARNEANKVLEYYADKHQINLPREERLIHLIESSLVLHGLSMTARFICNAVRKAKLICSENELSDLESSDQFYANFVFWVYDHRARQYQIEPFTRKVGPLAESVEVANFDKNSLAPLGLNYFESPISHVIELKLN